jgi:hypothetical protein
MPLGPKMPLACRSVRSRCPSTIAAREPDFVCTDEPARRFAESEIRRPRHNRLGPGLKNSVYYLPSPTADNIETDLDSEALQWAGLSAAMEILNA